RVFISFPVACHGAVGASPLLRHCFYRLGARGTDTTDGDLSAIALDSDGGGCSSTPRKISSLVNSHSGTAHRYLHLCRHCRRRDRRSDRLSSYSLGVEQPMVDPIRRDVGRSAVVHARTACGW